MENTEQKSKRMFDFQYKMIAVLIIAFCVLLILSIISYTSKDEFNSQVTLMELFSLLFGNDSMEAKAATTQNWLGLLGAFLSNALINDTFGYIVIFIPCLLSVWAVFLYNGKKISSKVIRRTYLYIILGVLIASFAGALQKTISFASLPKESSGAIGQYISTILFNMTGVGGALFILFMGMFLVILLGFNFDFKEFFNIIKLKLSNLPLRIIVKPSNKIVDEKEIIKEANHNKNDLEETILSEIQSDLNVNSKTISHKPIVEEIYEINNIQNDLKNANDEKTPSNKAELIQNAKSPIRITRVTIDENDTFIGTGRDFLNKAPLVNDKPLNPFEIIINPDVIKDEEIGSINEVIILPKNVEPLIIKSDISSVNKPIDPAKVKEEANNQEQIQMNETQEVTTKAKLIAQRFFQTALGESEHDSPNISDKATPIIEELKNDHINTAKHTFEVPLKEYNEDEVIPKVLPNEKVTIEFSKAIANEEEIQHKPLVVSVHETKQVIINPKFVLGNYIHEEDINFISPKLDLLVPGEEKNNVNEEELRMNAQILQEKLETFKIFIENLSVTPGPVVTQYEFVPAAGIKISKIESLADDLAMALKAKGIRIIAPIPGKGTVGVEIPNANPAVVRFSEVVNTNQFYASNAKLPLGLGMTISGEVYIIDLAKMPHLLIAGSTGSGKSVGINSIITSLLYRMHPSELKFVIIDPKKVELQQYSMLKDHYLATTPDIKDFIVTKPEDAVAILKSAVAEMEMRYDILASVGQRNISDYNDKVREGKYVNNKDMVHRTMPYIVVIIDELADLMLTASKEIEEPIIRLAQMARAIGIHLVVATQRPSVDVITGIIKANFPARIAYLVASKIDSRTILDMQGADQLLGMGDMLCLPPGSPKPVRIQNAFISTDEVENICQFIGNQKGYSDPYFLPSLNDKGDAKGVIDPSDRDPLFEDAARLIIRNQQGSVSLIQRRLKVGYARAGRIVDELESAGVVGPFDGSKARLVLMDSEDDLNYIL